MSEPGKVAGAGPETGAEAEGSDNPFAEAWKSSMAPWLSWMGVVDSAIQSRATPVFEDAAKALMRPDKMLENLAPLSERLREMSGLPQFADLPDMSKVLPSLEPTVELMAVAQQYLRVATPIWIEACKRFEAEAAQRQQKGETFDNANDALELWNNTLDRVLMEFNRSSEFAELQQRYLRGSMRQKVETRRYFEQNAKAVDNPTRSELDDVYRRLHELHREVVSLRRKLDGLSSAGEKGESAAVPPKVEKAERRAEKAERKPRSGRR